jgi:predicted transport protein
MLIIDGVKYKPWTPKDEEKEFHPMVRNCSKEIFGENSLYFDVKHVLKTASGIGSIPDAYVINLSKPFEWYVIENELASHPVYDHIVKQLTKFINGIANQNTKNQVLDMLYDEINKDNVLKATIQKLIDSTDIYRALSKLLSTAPRIVIIIDEKTSDVEEACQVLKYETDIVEFKTFVREGAENIRAHLFEPLRAAEKPKLGGKREVRRPEYYGSWEKKLAWVDENVRDIVEELTSRMARLGEITHKTSGPDYIFCKGKPSTRSRFAGLFLTKQALKVRIRTDTATFKDPEKWTGEKIYHWFFRTGQEKEFKIASKDQIDYAMALIKQSHALAE